MVRGRGDAVASYQKQESVSSHALDFPKPNFRILHIPSDLVINQRSYWIPGSYAPMLSEKHSSFLRLLKNKGFKEERMTKIGSYAIGKSKTLESNKSLHGYQLLRS